MREQWCNPNYPGGRACGILGAPSDAPSDAIATVFKDMQDEAMTRLLWFFAAGFKTIGVLSNVISTLGAHSLMSRRSLADGVQGALPDNQWMLDVQHWHETGLAGLQWSLLNTATGVPDKEVREVLFNLRPNGTVEEKLCNNQVSRCRLRTPQCVDDE